MSRLPFFGELVAGARSLARRPGFALLTAALLALGLGAATAVASVISAIARQGVPYREADRLVLVTGALVRGGQRETMPISWLDLADWRHSVGSFEQVAGYGDLAPFNLGTTDGVEHVEGELVTLGYFQALGIEPVAGRLFSPEEEDRPGGRRVVLVGHDLWRRSLGGERSIVGRAVLVNGESHEVVGVLPPGFRGLTDGAELWLPGVAASRLLAPAFLEQRRYRWLTGVARLRPDVSVAAAQAALDATTAALQHDHPDTNTGVGARLAPLFDAWYGDLRRGLRYLAGGALLLLLIACSNVSGLLLASTLARRRETALRSALGARRWQIFSQLLSESLLIGLTGCALGLLLASWLTRALAANPAAQFKSFVEVGLEPGSVAAALALSLASVLVVGLSPAWVTSRVDATEVLKQGSRGATGGRNLAQSALVVGEVALALVLLVGAGLLVRGFSELRGASLGFEPRELLTLRTYLDERGAEEARRRELARELLRRLPAVSGVESLALEGPGLPTDDWFGADFALETPPDPRAENKQLLLIHHVSAGYFETLGVPVLAGRHLGAEDDEGGAPVVMVSAAFVQRNWPGAPPARALGQGIRSFRDPTQPWIRIVGVVGDVRHRGLAAATVPAPDVYFPLLQRPGFQPPTLNLLARAKPGIEAEALAPGLRQALREVSADLAPYDLQTMAARLDRQAARPRFLALLMALFGFTALLLAGVGLYGLISYSVSRATRAIGVHMALGASRAEVLRTVVRRAAGLALPGIGIGIAASVGLERLLGGALPVPTGTPILALVASALALLGAALVAAVVPALRATRVDPVAALRSE